MKNLFLMFFAFILLVSCGERNPNSPVYGVSGGNDDNPDNPSSSKIDIFPDNVGSYWLYTSYDLDEQNARITESQSTDSVIIVGQVTKAKKQSKQFSTYNKTSGNYIKVKDEYYFVLGSTVNSLESWLNNFMGEMPINLIGFSDTSWVKVLDTKDDLWRIYRRKLDNSSIPNLPLGQISGDIDVLASWEGQKDIKIGGKTYKTEEYLFSFETDLSITIPFVGKQNIQIKRELYQYYAKNIGLVKSLMTSSSITIPIMGDIPMNGFDKEIIRYNVK